MRGLLVFIMLFFTSFLYGAGICNVYTTNNLVDCVENSSASTIRIEKNINVQSLRHRFPLKINRDVTIIGTTSSKTKITIDGLSFPWNNKIFKINSGNVTLKNLNLSSYHSTLVLNGSSVKLSLDNVEIVQVSNSLYSAGIDGFAKELNIKDSAINGNIGLKISNIKNIDISTSTIEAENNIDLLCHAIIVDNAKKFNVSNSNIRGGTAGIHVNSDDIRLRRSNVIGNVTGIRVSYSKEVAIINSTLRAKRGGIDILAITAAINIQKANTVKILGSTVYGTTDLALGSRAVEIGERVSKVFMNYDCLIGGYYGVGISSNNLHTVIMKNSKIQNYHQGGAAFWHDINTNLTMNKSCIYGLKPFQKEVWDNNVTENFWENPGTVNALNTAPRLDSCPLTNDCKLKPKFDAWNTFSDMFDRNISTKISNNTYNLTFTALDETVGKYEDLFKGTLCARIVDETNATLSNWKKEYLNEKNDINISFIVPKANKDSRVQMMWENDTDSTCPITINSNNKDRVLKGLSTDNFAIRPKEFDIENPNSKIISSLSFGIDFYGKDETNNSTTNYNEKLNDSFLVNWAEIDTKKCEDGEISNDVNWSFSNGYKQASYTQNKQGKFEVTIKDKTLECSRRFATVDCKDKNVSGEFSSDKDTSIETATKQVNITCKKAFGFDAYDTFRDGQGDKNISTKIANSTFDLKISPYKENHYDFEDFNGTACVRLIDDDENPLTNWQQLIYKDENVKTISIEKQPKASQKVRVQIEWKKRKTENCPLVNEDNATASSDEFAIRPKNFDIHAPAKAIAGRKFDLTFYGMDDANMSSKDYNETVDTTFKVTYKDKNSSCVTGEFDTNITTNWDFKNGYKKFNLSYSEVGELDIGISDLMLKCDDMYANVDCEDKNISGQWDTSKDLPIGEDNITITFTLDHFDINASLEDYTTYNSIASLDENFTYISDLNVSKDMYAVLKLNATAKSAEGNTTQNYANGCYAQDSTINVNYKTTYRTSNKTVDGAELSPDGNITFLQYCDINAISSDEPNTTKLGESMKLAVSKELFANGIVDIPLKVNFDRDYSKPVSPFKLSMSSVSIKDTSGVKDGKSDTSGSANFYYGRVRPTNVLTTVKDFDEFIEYEVYDTNNVNNSWLQNSLFWYRNRLENGSNTLVYGHTVDMTESKYNGKLPDDELSKLSKKELQNINKGNQVAKMKLNVGANVNQLDITVHLQTQPWLWFTNAQSPKAYSDTGTCQRHPCFDISYMNATGTLESGEFKGSDVNLTNKVDKSIQHGVKVFR